MNLDKYQKQHRTTESYPARKRAATRDALVAAYESYQRKEPGSINNLIGLVRKFAYAKLKYLDLEFNSGVHDADDFAQDAALAVWQSLDDFKGDPASFYAWVHKIAFNEGQASFNALKQEKTARVDMQHEVAEGDEAFEGDNPEVYDNEAIINVTKWTEYDEATGEIRWTRDPKRGKVETVPGSETSQFEVGTVVVDIPDWVKGDDLIICDFVLRGKTYKEIGVILGLS
ncbi:MAG: sigma factor, partial [Acidobacteriaceae bacterium]